MLSMLVAGAHNNTCSITNPLAYRTRIRLLPYMFELTTAATFSLLAPSCPCGRLDRTCVLLLTLLPTLELSER